ncbi:hypothetical protein BCO71033_05965 [Burkholderia contaminans]|uniref:Uncharacterized protein n=1 Tax=Burkholderia contaminans TaxID=488447 RepID=A0A6P3BNP6_9BURK|nr:hypothetical protein BCO71033_05965 [Burkholderia contaminans]
MHFVNILVKFFWREGADATTDARRMDDLRTDHTTPHRIHRLRATQMTVSPATRLKRKIGNSIRQIDLSRPLTNGW